MATWSLETDGEREAITKLVHESDRGAAIIAAIFVENRLERELRTRLRDDKPAQEILDRLFRPAEAFGAFATKIRLGFLLRIYGKQVHSELNIIKDIRNQFAHIIGEDAPKSFSDNRIRSRCFNLQIVENYHRPGSDSEPDEALSPEQAARISGIVYHHEPGPEVILGDPRRRYTETCGLIAARFKGTGQFLILGDEPEPWP